MAETVKQWEDLAQGPAGRHDRLRRSRCLSWSHICSVLLCLTDKYKVY